MGRLLALSLPTSVPRLRALAKQAADHAADALVERREDFRLLDARARSLETLARAAEFGMQQTLAGALELTEGPDAG